MDKIAPQQTMHDHLETITTVCHTC